MEGMEALSWEIISIMYATIQDLRQILPESMSIGDQNIGTPSPGLPTTKRDTIPATKATYFIRKAQEEIDARLRAFYLCPLRRIKIFETAILSDAKKGTSITVALHDSGPFSVGDMVRIQNRDTTEMANVTEVADIFTLKLDKLNNDFLQSDGALISLVEFPDPIPLITARLAVAIGFDELFAADQAPNVSSYGNTQRQLALNDLDGVLDGTIKLFGQELTGRRFIRGQLFDAYKNPVKDFSFGREKPSSGGG